jgi:hypothetical protein
LSCHIISRKDPFCAASYTPYLYINEYQDQNELSISTDNQIKDLPFTSSSGEACMGTLLPWSVSW